MEAFRQDITKQLEQVISSVSSMAPQTPAEQLWKMVDTIIQQFVKPGSKSDINIAADSRSSVLATFAARRSSVTLPPITLFAPAKRDVVATLVTNRYLPFQNVSSIQDVMSNPTQWEEFRTFLRSKSCEENADFLDAVNSFEKALLAGAEGEGSSPTSEASASATAAQQRANFKEMLRILRISLSRFSRELNLPITDYISTLEELQKKWEKADLRSVLSGIGAEISHETEVSGVLHRAVTEAQESLRTIIQLVVRSKSKETSSISNVEGIIGEQDLTLALTEAKKFSESSASVNVNTATSSEQLRVLEESLYHIQALFESLQQQAENPDHIVEAQQQQEEQQTLVSSSEEQQHEEQEEEEDQQRHQLQQAGDESDNNQDDGYVGFEEPQEDDVIGDQNASDTTGYLEDPDADAGSEQDTGAPR